MTRRALFLLTVPFLFACPGLGDEEGDVVENPTWNEHVEPIMSQRCVTCHGDSPTGSAPDGFRLDSYASDGDDIGAFEFRCSVKQRAVDGSPSFMPPGAPLPESERETLERWIEQGAPEFPGGPTGDPC